MRAGLDALHAQAAVVVAVHLARVHEPRAPPALLVAGEAALVFAPGADLLLPCAQFDHGGHRIQTEEAGDRADIVAERALPVQHVQHRGDDD